MEAIQVSLPENERMALIKHTLERISRENRKGFVGFSKWIEGTGYVENDAGGKYVDPSKPEGEGESIIPIGELALAHGYAFNEGRVEGDDMVVLVGADVIKVPTKALFGLTNNVHAWESSMIYRANNLRRPNPTKTI